MSETTVGSIVGTLRLDIVDFEAGIAKAQALADELTGKNVDVQVKVETAGAEAKLAAVAASEDKVSRSSGGASGGLTSVESAARKLADASSVANIAQLRLSEVQGSGTAKASSLASANQSVTKAQRDLSDLMKSSTPEVIRAADAMKQVDDSNTKVGKSSKDAGNGMALLIGTAVTLGTAIVPLAVASAGLAVGFGGMGAAGVLALVGIKQEMASGTTLGVVYTTMLVTLKDNLQTLGHTAASGVLAPFQAAVGSLQTKMPPLNTIIGQFSVITGKTAGILTTGLITAFIALAPLARDAGVYILNLSTRFAGMMSGPGVVTFGDYVRSVFPQFMQAVESIVTAAIRLVAALAPLGLGTLGILRTFTDLINALPVNVLAVLAQTAGSVYLGFAAFKALSGPLSGVGTALRFLGVDAEAAAAGVRGLTMAAGAIGVVIAVATALFSAHAEAARADQQAVDSMTEALVASNGVIDANVRLTEYKNLVDNGAIAHAQALGLSLSLVTDSAMGSTGASRLLNDQMVAMSAATEANTTGLKGNGLAAIAQRDNITKLMAELGLSTTQFGSATAAAKAQASAMTTGASATDSLGAAQQRAAAAQQDQANTAAAATQKMRDENDAAGLLKQSLDLLNGKSISAAQAQNALDSSLVNMGDHTTTTGKQVKWTTTSIENMSSASVALRGELVGQVTNMQNVIEANGGLSKSTAGSRAEYEKMRQKIIDNAVAHGVNRAAVTAFINTVLKTPTGRNTDFTTNAPAATVPVNALALMANNAGHRRNIVFSVSDGSAVGQIGALKALLATIPTSRTITMYVAAGASNAAAMATVNSITRRAANTYGPANGGILTGFASGGITGFPSGESHIAQIAPAGSMRLWAEPETGGEAYIPLAPAKRARSVAIYEQTGKALGVSAGTDMSGVLLALAEQTAEIRALGQVVHTELQAHARTTQTMQRQLVGA